MANAVQSSHLSTRIMFVSCSHDRRYLTRYRIFLLSARVYYYFKHRNDPPPPPTPVAEPSKKKQTRTQDFIEKMLILKVSPFLAVVPLFIPRLLGNSLAQCDWCLPHLLSLFQHVSWVASSSEGTDHAGQSDTSSDMIRSDQQNNAISIMKRAKSNLVLHEGDDEESGMDLCAICLCPYENGDQICWSNNQSCPHHFHAACGIAWLAKHEDCPICRNEYLVEPEEETEEQDIEQGQQAQ